MFQKTILSGLSLTLLSSASTAFAQDESLYEAGHGALQRFSSGAGIAATALGANLAHHPGRLPFIDLVLHSSPRRRALDHRRHYPTDPPHPDFG